MPQKKNTKKVREPLGKAEKVLLILTVVLITLMIIAGYKVLTPKSLTATIAESKIFGKIVVIESDTPIRIVAKSEKCFFLFVNDKKIKCDTEVVSTGNDTCKTEHYVDTIIDSSTISVKYKLPIFSVSAKLSSDKPFSMTIYLSTMSKVMNCILILFVGILIWLFGLLMIKFVTD